MLRDESGVETCLGASVFGGRRGNPVAYLRPFRVLTTRGVGISERDCELHFFRFQEQVGFASAFAMVQGGQSGFRWFL